MNLPLQAPVPPPRTLALHLLLPPLLRPLGARLHAGRPQVPPRPRGLPLGGPPPPGPAAGPVLRRVDLRRVRGQGEGQGGGGRRQGGGGEDQVWEEGERNGRLLWQLLMLPPLPCLVLELLFLLSLLGVVVVCYWWWWWCCSC